MGNLSIRCFDRKTPGQELCPPPRSSAAMSFSRLFLGEVVSTRARLRFTNRGQHAVNSVCRSSILQRAANYLLTVCLTSGGKRSMDTLPRTRASQNRWATTEVGKPGTPEFCVTLKLLAYSVVRRRNVPPFSKVSKQ